MSLALVWSEVYVSINSLGFLASLSSSALSCMKVMRGPSALTHTTLTLREKQPTLKERRMTICDKGEKRQKLMWCRSLNDPKDISLSLSQFSLQTSLARVLVAASCADGGALKAF